MINVHNVVPKSMKVLEVAKLLNELEIDTATGESQIYC